MILHVHVMKSCCLSCKLRITNYDLLIWSTGLSIGFTVYNIYFIYIIRKEVHHTRAINGCGGMNTYSSYRLCRNCQVESGL